MALSVFPASSSGSAAELGDSAERRRRVAAPPAEEASQPRQEHRARRTPLWAAVGTHLGPHRPLDCLAREVRDPVMAGWSYFFLGVQSMQSGGELVE